MGRGVTGVSKIKRIVILTLTFVLIAANVAYASIPYEGYTYYTFRDTYPSPPIFEPLYEIYGENMGVGSLKSPEDIFLGSNGHIYVADTGNNRILVVSPDFEGQKIIDKFVHEVDGQQVEDVFNAPTGIFVTDAGHIYVADSQNARIVELDGDGNFVRIIGRPESELIPANYKYIPMKVGVDKAGRLFVAAQNAIDGLFQFTPSGEFDRFFGSTKVKVNPIERIWRMIYTKDQKERASLNLSKEYSNLTVDSQGFIYTTLKGQYTEQVKRLNISGNDIIKYNDITVDRFGDQIDVMVGTDTSQFVDASIDEDNNILALDLKTNKIFWYNILGDMLGVFGGKGGNGDIVGLLGSPVAIEQKGDKVFIVDSTKNAIIVYEMTEFGSNIKKANKLYIEGQYEESVEPWREVLKMNANYELAYVGIGNALYKQEKYEEAMKYFDLGNNKKGYSKAKKEYRTIVLKQNFPYIMTGLILLLILLAIWKRIARKHNLSFKRLYGEE